PRELLPHELSTFEYQGYLVRVLTGPDGEPWWLALDVCLALAVKNVSAALARLDDDERDTIILNEGTPGNPSRAIVNESGLNELILGSRKPSARRFRKWVTSKVLLAIRKTGRYAVPGADLVPVDPDFDPMLHQAKQFVVMLERQRDCERRL